MRATEEQLPPPRSVSRAKSTTRWDFSWNISAHSLLLFPAEMVARSYACGCCRLGCAPALQHHARFPHANLDCLALAVHPLHHVSEVSGAERCWGGCCRHRKQRKVQTLYASSSVEGEGEDVDEEVRLLSSVRSSCFMLAALLLLLLLCQCHAGSTEGLKSLPHSRTLAAEYASSSPDAPHCPWD